MKYTIQISSLFFLVIITITCILCFPLSDARAREPRVVTVSTFDNSVGGEPGEDPHLHPDPYKEPECIWAVGSQGGNSCTRGDYSNAISPDDSRGYRITDKASRVNLGWYMFLQLILGTPIR